MESTVPGKLVLGMMEERIPPNSATTLKVEHSQMESSYLDVVLLKDDSCPRSVWPMG